jgi:proteic killer suppression protein
MIQSFADGDSQAVFEQRKPRRLSAAVANAAFRKLVQLHTAPSLNDLRVPPGNRLEKLKGKRAGQYSMRVNDQFRICFRWLDGNAFNVEVADYHDD